MKTKYAILGAVMAMSALVRADELGTAREALRDGLWAIARKHAERSNNPESDRVIFESYARERRWSDLIQATSSHARAQDESATYYRALAEYRLGNSVAAERILLSQQFANSSFQDLAVCLRSAIKEDAGNHEEALALIESLPEITKSSVDARMVIAGLRAKSGDREGAESEWEKIVAAATNVSERAFTVAAVELDREPELRAAYSNAVEKSNRRLAGFALGRKLIGESGGYQEGARIIRLLVWADPDAPESKSTFLALGDAALAQSQPQEALKIFQSALDAWPDCAKLPRIHFGRGWALSALKRYDEALEAFATAGELSDNDTDRALALVKRGDTLAAANRGDEAIKIYREVVDTYPGSFPTHVIAKIVASREHERKGREHYHAYAFEEADREFAAAAKADESLKPRMDFFHVLCLYGQGKDDKARQLAEELAVKCPDMKIKSAAIIWLAKLDYNAGEWAKARERFAEFIKLDPTSAEVPAALLWTARSAFAAGDFANAITTVTKLLDAYPDSEAARSAVLVQAEALIELSRFDEAVVVLDRLAAGETVESGERYRVQMLKADALFAMGADNSVRYSDALQTYIGIRAGEALPPSERIIVSFRIAKTLEKLRRFEEALDCYYSDVVLAYREGRSQGMRYGDEALAAFSRAAFQVAEDLENRGRDAQAMNVLKLVANSDVPAAEEAKKRIDRISKKGDIL